MDVVWGRFIMTEYRRIFWIITLPAILITATGCATNNWHTINEELSRDGSGLQKESGQAITGYQLNNGPRDSYKGWVGLAAQDSTAWWDKELVFWKKNSGILVPGPIYSLDKVQALKVHESNSEMTVLLVVAITVAFVAIVGGLIAAQSLNDSFN
jgi:hypothetical protein